MNLYSLQDNWIQDTSHHKLLDQPASSQHTSNPGVAINLPFPCSLCPRTFSNTQRLVWHEREHTGEKPFICTECNYSSPRRAHLKRHSKSRHNMSEEEYMTRVRPLYAELIG